MYRTIWAEATCWLSATGISRDIYPFCTTPVVQKVKITWDIPIFAFTSMQHKQLFDWEIRVVFHGKHRLDPVQQETGDFRHNNNKRPCVHKAPDLSLGGLSSSKG